MTFWVEIKGEIDSRSLWEQIKGYGANLTDLIDRSLVYGEASVSRVGEIISVCALYGDIEARVSKGGAEDEQAQKEEGEASS